ncbi:MAG: phosphate acetyltransferase [Hyphomonadaceae bacterium]|nr:MAG: MaoC-like dehydratase [Caulobacteraceae bacterium]MBT9447228.1 phosphate acetyltransferase [Hyphomonadaceae bacterium]TPW02233.1 MAG: MaoC-like dehydratase [Alphaproteobacteria bacterium]
MRIGDSATVTRTFTAADVLSYVDMGGAAPHPGETPEPLIGALFSYLLGVELPGPGTNYLKQNTDHHAPARLDAPLTATVRVVQLRPEKHLVDLETTCVDDTGTLVASGRALVYARDVTGAFD